jgi:hypothetical protein
LPRPALERTPPERAGNAGPRGRARALGRLRPRAPQTDAATCTRSRRSWDRRVARRLPL